MAVRDGVVAWLGSDDVGRAQFPDAADRRPRRRLRRAGVRRQPRPPDRHRTAPHRAGPRPRPTSREHCLRLVAEHVAAHPGQPIWGHGWDDTGWPDRRRPTTADLDAVVGALPAYLARVDVHSAAASSALRGLVPGLTAVAGFDPQLPLSADAHHLVRAEARGLLTWQQRDRRPPGRPGRSPRPPASSPSTNAPDRDIGGAEDWQELRDTRARRRGRRLLGRGGVQRRAGPSTHRGDRRARAGRRPVRRRRTGVAHRVAVRALRRRPRRTRQLLPRRRHRSPSI